MGFIIEPEKLYLEWDLLAIGLFTDTELARARQSGQLRCKEIRRGKRAYLGRWLLDWLEQPADSAQPRSKPRQRRRAIART